MSGSHYAWWCGILGGLASVCLLFKICYENIIYIYVFVSATKTVVTDQMHSWVKCSTRARPDVRAGGQTLN